MNNGFNGTGTAFILYIVLAFCMPIVYLYRLLRHRKDFGYRFVAKHFFIGLLVTSIAVFCVGFFWHRLASEEHVGTHHDLVDLAYIVIVTIITWILIPRIVRLSLRLSHQRDKLNYHNPLIEPWFVQPFHYEPTKRPKQHAQPRPEQIPTTAAATHKIATYGSH